MSEAQAALRLLTRAEMLRVAKAFGNGGLKLPVSGHGARKFVRDEVAGAAAAALNSLAEVGGSEAGLAAWMALLADERQGVQLAHDEVELVWTGPEGVSSVSRDTWVAVTELFRSAESEIVLASYALVKGKALLEELAKRMREVPALKVRMYLHVDRPYKDTTTSEAELLRKFAEDFRDNQWPGDVRLPEVYFDPRTVQVSTEKRASLHAKTIVVDGKRAFVTSANLTEAAQQRNIEAGVLIENVQFAKALREQFEALRVHGLLQPVPGLTGN